MENKAKELLDFNCSILMKWMDQLELYPQLFKYKKINHLYKAIDKLLVKSKKTKVEDYQDYFYNIYDLIYKKYFTLNLTDYFEEMVRNIDLNNLEIIQFVWDLWFQVNALQWWWFQLSNKIDYTNDDIVQQIEERTFCSLGYCLHDILTIYQRDQNFDPQFLPIMQEILNEYTDVNDNEGFARLETKIDKIDPKISFQEVVVQQDEEQLDRYVFCEMIKHFKKIIDYVNEWTK